MTQAATAAECAILASCAEDMFAANDLTPALDPRAADDWTIVGYITGADALFGAQVLGLGDRVYYGFLAVSKTDMTQYIAVIRGTETDPEWFIDAEALLVPGPPVGLVEAGFWSVYESMQYNWRPVAEGLHAAIPPGSDLTVIGHSLGSALATYLMAELARAPFAPHSREYTVGGQLFASPKPGDQAFAKDVDQVVGHFNYTVYNFFLDVVPRVPLSLLFGQGFQSLPNTQCIKPSQGRAKIASSLGCWHSAESYAALLGADIRSPCILGSNP